MTFTSRIAAVAIIGLLAGSTFAQDSAKHGVQAEQRLPEDTFMYFSIPSVSVMKKRFSESHGSGIWSDPAFDEFKAELSNALGEQFEEFKSEMEENMGVSPMDLLNIPSGQVSLAVSSMDDEIGFILFVDFGDSRRVVDGLLKKAADGMSENGMELKTEEFSGTEITSFDIPGAEDSPVGSSMHYCIRDTEFVLSSSLPILKNSISNWDGSDADTFTANANWSYVKERCGSSNGHPAMNWYVDPIGLFNTFLESGAAPQQMAIAGAFLPTLGLDKLQGMGGTIDMGVGKYDTLNQVVYLCEEANGILKVFTLKEGNMTPPKWIPKAVAMYSGMNWDVGGAYNAIETLADSFGSPGAMAQQIEAMASQGPGIHIKDDIIDQMTGKIQVISGESSAAAEGGPNMLAGSMAMAFGCKDEAKMNDLLTKLTETGGFPGSTRDLNDTNIVEIPNPQGGPTMALAVTRGSLMFTTDVKLLEQIIRGGDDSLVESDAYKRVAAEFPAKAMALSFVDVKVQYKGMYDGLRNGDPAELFPGMGEVFDAIDFTKLPKFDALEKYLLPAGGFTVPDERGAYSKSFTLKP